MAFGTTGTVRLRRLDHHRNHAVGPVRGAARQNPGARCSSPWDDNVKGDGQPERDCVVGQSVDSGVMSGNSLPMYLSTAWSRLARPRRAHPTAPAAVGKGGAQAGTGLDTHSTDPSQDDEVTYPGFGILFLGWSAIAILTSSRHFFQPTRPEGFDLELVFVYIACFAPWAILTRPVFWLERRYPLGVTGWPKHLAALVLWSVPTASVGSFLMLASATAGWNLVGRSRGLPLDPAWWIREFPVAGVCFWSSVAIGYFIRSQTELRAKERRVARLAVEKSQLEAGLNRAQLDVLRAKLNPHFLFNSLQNISVLTGQDPETASRMLARLGDLLRAVLKQDSSAETTLRDEIELSRAYVALEQLRFGDRMRVEFDIPSEVQGALVPCFILQPLIENAVVHGLRSVKRDGVIAVSASGAGDELVLRVRDNGVGLDNGDASNLKMGVGLGSTCERLERMYPNRHSFRITGPAQGGAEVLITIPLRIDDGAGRAGER